MSTGDAGSTSCSNLGKQLSHTKLNRSVQKDTNWTAKIELIPIVLDSGIGSAGEKKDGGATSSMWWMPWLLLQVVCQT